MWLCLRVKVERQAATLRLTQIAQEDDGIRIVSAPRFRISSVSLGWCPCWKPKAKIEWQGRRSVLDEKNRCEIPLPSCVEVDDELRATAASYAKEPTGHAAFLIVSPTRVNTVPWDPLNTPFNPALGVQDPNVELNRITTRV